ncbi:MAG TPA: asparagine synthase (glutamine-hydrolyzing), partial [Candidatus Polarisedimenticolia bacterium]|nr:asparagine synthase (glutamine-hydrolyzing) [Candidatus Polarisedimenticolia bacterium]
MCGIAGIFRRGGAPIEAERLVAMRDDQRHRGPDAEGLHVVPHAGLAFNRLAIIDLSPAANQPMVLPDDGLAIVFNGEIYNFREVRAQLEAEGHAFTTKSDTEVILRGYRAWGLDVVPRLDGMFAMAIWDPGRRTMHLVRDRLGKKPLFYSDAGGEVVFASEVRALTRGLAHRPPPSARAIDSYLAFLAVPGEMSIWEGVHKLPPASILSCTLDGATMRRYWRLKFDAPRIEDENEALERLDTHLFEATKRRLISDVPLGAFLSGGVDSSAVVAQMARATGKVRTFTITLADAAHDESPWARMVADALGTEHQEIRVEPDAAAILPRLVWHYGEPFADSSAIPSYYVSQATRRAVTVVLNGDGGDEGFAGYGWHRAAHLAAWYRRNF